MPTPLPQGPWQRIGVDLCFCKGKDYLVMCDYYSRWIEVLLLTSTTSTAVISRMKDVFARFGVPIEIISDNGPQFTSAEFKDFASKYDFTHVTSSPYLPNSNGEAERAVQTAKKMLSQKDPWLALMVYRDTPISATGASPSQLMMGRHLRTTLPVPTSTLEPAWPDRETILAKDQSYKSHTAQYHNQRSGVQPLPPLQPGDPVLVKTDDQKGWSEKGIVQGEAETPRSYQVETKSGVVRRNRRHLINMPPMQPNKPVEETESEARPPDQQNELRRSGRLTKKPERLIEQM
jgi:transposase InsO family protein